MEGDARAQFEAWAKSKKYVEHGPDCYVELSTQRRWTGFAAGLAARQRVGLVPSNPLLAVARRNIRQFLAKASFASEMDRLSVGQCLDFMDAAIDAPAGQTADTGLRAMHLRGPDDIHAAPSKAQASEVANAINREFAPSQIRPYAVVVRWNGSAEQHAESFADWKDQWEQCNVLVAFQAVHS